jgi:hypothetical protein
MSMTLNWAWRLMRVKDCWLLNCKFSLLLFLPLHLLVNIILYIVNIAATMRSHVHTICFLPIAVVSALMLILWQEQEVCVITDNCKCLLFRNNNCKCQISVFP